jgi:acylphosphatase
MDARHRRLTARFEGRVQGVGFRMSAVQIAIRHRIVGVVRNLPDGSVDLVAEGEEAALLRFLGDLRSSYVYRHVIAESLAWSNAVGGYRAFDISYES